MKRTVITERIQEGFFELAPDIFDKISEAIENIEDEEIDSENNVININAKNTHIYNNNLFKVLSRVAILVMIVGLGLALYGTSRQSSAYVVVMDVNPSIRIELNKKYGVQNITGLNIDGEKLINGIEWEKENSVELVVDKITDKLIEEGYLTENGGILLTLVKTGENNDYRELKEILNNELENDAKKRGVTGIKVAFLASESKADKTGKEILKDHMVEEYNMNVKNIDDMNIEDMINFVEEKDDTVLEKVYKKEGHTDKIEKYEKSPEDNCKTNKKDSNNKKHNNMNNRKDVLDTISDTDSQEGNNKTDNTSSELKKNETNNENSNRDVANNKVHVPENVIATVVPKSTTSVPNTTKVPVTQSPNNNVIKGKNEVKKEKPEITYKPDVNRPIVNQPNNNHMIPDGDDNHNHNHFPDNGGNIKESDGRIPGNDNRNPISDGSNFGNDNNMSGDKKDEERPVMPDYEDTWKFESHDDKGGVYKYVIPWQNNNMNREEGALGYDRNNGYEIYGVHR